MPRLFPALFGWVFCITCSQPVLAQNAAQNAPPAEPTQTIHATVNEVALDLTVRDKRGKLIKNLKPGDVEIYEDGVKQQIKSLRLVTGAPPKPGPALSARCAGSGRNRPSGERAAAPAQP